MKIWGTCCTSLRAPTIILNTPKQPPGLVIRIMVLTWWETILENFTFTGTKSKHTKFCFAVPDFSNAMLHVWADCVMALKYWLHNVNTFSEIRKPWSCLYPRFVTSGDEDLFLCKTANMPKALWTTEHREDGQKQKSLECAAYVTKPWKERRPWP